MRKFIAIFMMIGILTISVPAFACWNCNTTNNYDIHGGQGGDGGNATIGDVTNNNKNV